MLSWLQSLYTTLIGKTDCNAPLPPVTQQIAKTIIFTIIQNLTIIRTIHNFVPEINSNAIMNKLLTILSLALLALVAMPVDAATRTKRTITLKKVPRQSKDKDGFTYKVPSIAFTCYVDKDSGIQPLDTSEIESYEIWDRTDTIILPDFQTDTIMAV